MSESTPLQFDTADFQTSTGQPVCTACKYPIVSDYFSVGTQILCARCRDALATFESSGRMKRLAVAGALGFGAALIGATFYTLISYLTGYEFSLASIAVGFLVGAAVRKGAMRRGGLGYQLLAALLTYCSIGLSYTVHFVLIESDKHSASQPSAGPSDTPIESDRAALEKASEPNASSDERVAGVSSFGIVAARVVVGMAALSLALPVFVGVQSPLVFVIIGFAVLQAWNMNRKQRFDIQGPFRLGGPTPA